MANYYVSSTYTGTVSNGSLSTPWKTLAQVQGAMSTFVAGDFISFKCGESFTGTLNITRSGSAGNPITFNSYGTGAKPKFIGTGSQIQVLFSLTNRSHITFDNLSIIDEGISPTDRTIQARILRAFVLNNSNNCIVRRCDMDRVGVGLYCTGLNGGNNIVELCDIGNMRMVRNTPTTVNADDDYGANPVVVASANNIIRNNYFHDCWATSFDYGLDGGAVEFYEEGAPVTNNQVLYNTFYDCNGVAEFGGKGGVISGITFAYNKFIWNGGGFYAHNQPGVNFYAQISNLRFFNNVFIEHQIWRRTPSSSSAIFRFKTSPTIQNTLTVRNNVIELYGNIDVFRSQWGTAGTLIESNNVYRRNTQTTGSLLNIILGAGSVDNPTTPYFTNTTDANPLNWNYTPLPNSILVNKGINVGLTSDFAGNPISGTPDIGILELNSTPPPPTPLTTNVSFTPITTIGGDSTVTVTASGGTTPYTGVGVLTRKAGTHEFKITDAVGQTVTHIITISDPVSTFVINGLTVGTANGVGSIAYSIDGGAFQPSANFTNLVAGKTYTIQARDGQNAVKTMTVTIQP